MSEDLEKKEQKATLIKHKRTEAPPKKESGDGKKKVVVVKKKVVVKKAHKVVANKDTQVSESTSSQGQGESGSQRASSAPGAVRRTPRNPDRPQGGRAGVVGGRSTGGRAGVCRRRRPCRTKQYWRSCR